MGIVGGVVVRPHRNMVVGSVTVILMLTAIAMVTVLSRLGMVIIARRRRGLGAVVAVRLMIGGFAHGFPKRFLLLSARRGGE
jgi:hypothetical protein